jgi:hypothetical protein
MSTGIDYDDWHSESDNLVTLAHGFYRWAPFQAPDELEELEELMQSVEPPPEPEADYDDWHSESGGPYWTIARMFEDL